MRVLITGGGGQLGRALAGAFAGEEVWAPGHGELDVTDETAVQAAIGEQRSEWVIHAAAWTDTAGCEADPERAMLVNGAAPGMVAHACSRFGVRMVYISSNEVFDGEKGNPYVEDDPPQAVNAYGRSKLEGERRVREASGEHCIVRTAWLYGPGRISFPEKIVRAARERGGIQAVTDEVATPTWTLDLADAIARLVRAQALGTYHLTNGGECSRLEWAREVLRLAGLGAVHVEPVTQERFGAPYRKPAHTVLANTRAAALGIMLRDWGEALAEHLAGAGAHLSKT